MGRVFKLLMAGMLIGLFIIGAPVQAQNPCPANAALDQANAALNAGQYQEAITAFSCVIESNPQNADAYIGRAQAYILNGDWYDATPDYMTASVYYQGQPTIGKLLSDRYEQMIKDKPDDLSGLMLSAYWRWYLDDFAGALSDLKIILTVDPNNVFALTFRGSSQMFTGGKESEADWARALALSPDNAQIYTIIGSTYRWAGDQTKALENYKLALKLSPDSAYLYRVCGLSDLSKNDYAQAIVDFKRSAELGGLSPVMRGDNFTFLGQAYLALNRQDDANAAFADAEKALPGSYWTSFNVAYAYFSAGQTSTSIGYFHDYVTRLGGETVSGDLLTIGTARRLQLLGQGQRVYRLPLELKNGMTVTIEATRTQIGNADPLILLLDPAGKAVAFNDDIVINQDANSRIDNFVPTMDGRYMLLLTTTLIPNDGYVDVLVSAKST